MIEIRISNRPFQSTTDWAVRKVITAIAKLIVNSAFIAKRLAVLRFIAFWEIKYL